MRDGTMAGSDSDGRSAPRSDPAPSLPSPLLARALVASTILMVFVVSARFAGIVGYYGSTTVADFKVFHLVGQMVWEGRIGEAYHAATMMPLERALSGTDIFLPWTYPPLFDLVVAPLGLMPLWLAYLAFVGPTLVAYLMVLHRLAGPYFSLALAAIFPAICILISCGQNGFLTGALVGLACLLLLRRDDGRSGWSGVPLGMMAIKPHLAVCLALHVLARRRWTVVITAACVVLAGAALSTLAFGPSIWTAFLDGVAESRLFLERGLYPLHRMISTYATARTLGASAGLAMAIQVGVALFALAAVWLSVRRAGARQSLGLAVLTTLLISPYAYDYDLPIYGIGLALVLPDLIRLATPVERIAMVGLSWLASGWGMVMSLVLDRRYGEAGMPPDLMALSLGGIALPLLTALIWRVLRRDWSVARAGHPALRDAPAAA